MNYYSVFTKQFSSDILLNIDSIIFDVRKTDGYINAGKLCSAYNCLFADYNRLKQTKEFLTFLKQDMINFGLDVELVMSNRKDAFHGTYVHPIVAIDIARWISPKFSVLFTKLIYQLFLTGSVNVQSQISVDKLEQIRIKQLEENLTALEQKYSKLEIKHERYKERKTRYQFDKGNCFYVVRDLDCKYTNRYKFGQTNNFTNRIGSMRTNTPRMTVERLIYIDNHIEFESRVKAVFEKEGHLIYLNHEFVQISIDYINEIVDSILKDFECQIKEIPRKTLEFINKRYLECLTKDDGIQVDQIFNYIPTLEKETISIDDIKDNLQEFHKNVDNLKEKVQSTEERVQNLQDELTKTKQITYQVEQHEQEIERIHQRISADEPIYKPIIFGKRITNITDMKLDDF